MTASSKESQQPQRRPWVKPELRTMGTVGKILQGGGGKASVLAADSGDSHKPSGQS